VLSVALCKKRDNVSVTQTLPDRFRVITTVAEQAIGTMAWTSSLSLQGWDGINQCECLLRVVAIGPGKLKGQLNSAPVANQMTLAAKFGSVGGIGTCLKPPKTARVEQLSRTARDQSSCP
jgi:hypothetical protein